MDKNGEFQLEVSLSSAKTNFEHKWAIPRRGSGSRYSQDASYVLDFDGDFFKTFLKCSL